MLTFTHNSPDSLAGCFRVKGAGILTSVEV